ncbi:MAG: adenosine deaminase, partial [Rhodobacteraceae bacterium]|nr:adenosine deaminase [Paracoccaceae bacterium]
TDMTKEYAALSHAFGWGKEDFSSLNKTAIKAAFCDTATKDTIIKRLDAE